MDERTMEQKIARINALYHKSQTQGLTEEEKAEQAALRQEYVANVRANLRGQLDSITIQKEDGTLENLGEKYGGKHGEKPSRAERQERAESTPRI